MTMAAQWLGSHQPGTWYTLCKHRYLKEMFYVLTCLPFLKRTRFGELSCG